MRNLDKVTLFGLDCLNIDRLIKAVDICVEDLEFAEIKLLSSIDSFNNNVVQIEPPIRSIREYSEFMLKKMNDYIDTDFALVVQYDGFVLNADAWDDHYLKYDYIGAPLSVDGELVVGNGGFSLRSKKLLKLLQEDDNIKIEENPEHKYGANEDWIISVIYREYLESKGIKFAPVSLAHKFSFEKNREYGAKWNGQFGCHGVGKWTDISAWTEKHPEFPIDNTLIEKPDEHFD